MKTRLLVWLTCMLSFLAVAQFAVADTIEFAEGRHPEFYRHGRHNFHSHGDFNDPIVNISGAGNSCSTGGTNNVCLNGSPFSLEGILDGSIALQTTQLGGAGSWRVINDTGHTVMDLILYYFGNLASNASITVNTQGAGSNYFSVCGVTPMSGIPIQGNCGQGTANNPPLPLQMLWSAGATGTGLAPGQVFNITISSFAHAGQDAGCISGTSNCMPKDVPEIPEPGTLALLGTGMFGIGALLRRKLFKAPAFTIYGS